MRLAAVAGNVHRAAFRYQAPDRRRRRSGGHRADRRHGGRQGPEEQQADGLRWPLPQLRLSATLAVGQVLLMSDYEAASFDSLHFGPLDGPGVLQAMRPVLPWP